MGQRTTKRVESVTFNGTVFRRYPEAKQHSDRVYFTPGSADRKRGTKRLHQEIWKAAHGPIPVDHDIHHRDHDHDNNDLSNLVCLHNATHREHHADQPRTDAQRAAWSKNLLHAAEWHHSEAGRAWHAEHGRRTWDGREARTLVCSHCGTSFETLDRNTATRYCSNKCRSYARKARGDDDEDRTCELCSASFRVNKYAQKRCCSRSCAGTLARRKG